MQTDYETYGSISEAVARGRAVLATSQGISRVLLVSDGMQFDPQIVGGPDVAIIKVRELMPEYWSVLTRDMVTITKA